jgi:hypothetical protein
MTWRHNSGIRPCLNLAVPHLLRWGDLELYRPTKRPSNCTHTVDSDRVAFFLSTLQLFNFHFFFHFQVSLNSDNNNGTLHEDLRTLMTSRWILLEMRNVSDKSCRENQNTNFIFSNFFSENRAVYEIMWKNMVESEGHRWQYNTVQKKLRFECWLRKAAVTDTHSFYLILIIVKSSTKYFIARQQCKQNPFCIYMATLNTFFTASPWIQWV